MEKLIKHKPSLMINIAASPFSYNHEYLRKRVLQENATRYQLPLIYVNQVGAQTEIIFDGSSKVINNSGNVVLELKSFSEEISYIDTSEINYIPEKSSIISNKNERIHNALIFGIKDYFSKMNFKSAIIGLSGGIDSAVTLVLAVKALGNKNVKALLMPSKFSSDHSVKDAVELAENLSIAYEIINIQSIVDSFEKALKDLFANLPFGIAEENIQSRVRGSLLMAISNKFGDILLNTSNKSEVAVGYGTLYGDMNGSLSVIGDVYKTDIFELSRYINSKREIIPINTINKAPSAELRPNQKDVDSLPEYDILDKILFCYIEQKLVAEEIIALGLDKETVQKVISMVNKNEYKRYQAPPILRISSKSFGSGRRMPLVAEY